MQQRSPDWHKFRKNHIGSSDAPIIMGVSPWKTPLQLYNEKINDLIIDVEENEAMKRGIELEPIALSIFEEHMNLMMLPDVIVHPEHEWMSASVDGIDLDNKFVIEIKCPGIQDHQTALKGIVPEKYVPQLQHQLAVTGLNEIYYMSYVSDSDFIIFKVKKDNDYIEKLIAAELEFWKRIQDRNPPEPTDRDCIQIQSEEWEICVKEWDSLQQTRKTLDEREQSLRKQFIRMADGRSSEGNGLKITKSIRKGSVVYNNMPQLIGVDLDPFRKESKEIWTITMNGKN